MLEPVEKHLLRDARCGWESEPCGRSASAGRVGRGGCRHPGGRNPRGGRDGRFSRLPVYEENLDHILGYVHTKDLLRQHYLVGGWTSQAVAARPVRPETMTLDRLLILFREKRDQLAIAVDEYGVTKGIGRPGGRDRRVGGRAGRCGGRGSIGIGATRRRVRGWSTEPCPSPSSDGDRPARFDRRGTAKYVTTVAGTGVGSTRSLAEDGRKNARGTGWSRGRRHGPPADRSLAV